MSLGLLLFASKAITVVRPKWQFKTVANTSSFSLPAGFSATNILVDWGDDLTSTSTSHTYANAGQYVITVYYDTLSSLGTTPITAPIEEFMWLDANDITSGDSLFSQSTTLKKIGTVDLSKAKVCDQMFYQCTNLTEIDSLDLSSCTSAWRFLQGCSTLTTITSLTITNKCKSFDNFITNCSVLTALPHTLDSSGATSMNSWCSGCTAITDLGGMSNFTGIADFSNMFSGLSNIVQMHLAMSSTTSDVEEMFEDCSSMNIILGTFDIGSATSLWLTFEGTALTEIPDFDASGLTTADESFENCTALTDIPALDFSGVTSLYRTFNNTPALTNIQITGIKVSFDLSTTGITADSQVINLFSNLATVSGQTITLNATQYEAIVTNGLSGSTATGKGWSFVQA